MKIIKNIFITIYIILAIFVTISLLSINDYRVPVFGDHTLVAVDKNSETEKTLRGSLAIYENNNDAEAGDEVLIYNVYEKRIHPTPAEVQSAEDIYGQERTYHLSNGQSISSQFYIGKVDEAIVIPVLGTILSILGSKWGFLFLIILPIFVAFLYEVYTIYEEAQKAKRSERRKTEDYEE